MKVFKPKPWEELTPGEQEMERQWQAYREKQKRKQQRKWEKKTIPKAKK
jgi:hypothetical protein